MPITPITFVVRARRSRSPILLRVPLAGLRGRVVTGLVGDLVLAGLPVVLLEDERDRASSSGSSACGRRPGAAGRRQSGTSPCRCRDWIAEHDDAGRAREPSPTILPPLPTVAVLSDELLLPQPALTARGAPRRRSLDHFPPPCRSLSSAVPVGLLREFGLRSNLRASGARARYDPRSSRSGGTGRRAGLKIRFPPGSVGSIPTFGTSFGAVSLGGARPRSGRGNLCRRMTRCPFDEHRSVRVDCIGDVGSDAIPRPRCTVRR